MIDTLSTPRIRPSDRLALALFLAAVLHGILILGLSFSEQLRRQHNRQHPLDVVLVHTQAAETPDKAEHIAQFDQEASGSADRPDRPSNPTSSLLPTLSEGRAAVPQQQQPARFKMVNAEQYLHSTRAREQVASRDRTEQQQEAEEVRRKREALLHDMEIARLAAELEVAERRYAERPKIHFIDALSAKSAVEAKYIDDWVQRVEGIGNLNYPAEARRDRISGKLILNVLLDNDGSVLRVQVAVSSGSKVLDDAAVNIVHMSSPFPPFPPEMRKAYDQLMITRTWSFNTDGI